MKKVLLNYFSEYNPRACNCFCLKAATIRIGKPLRLSVESANLKLMTQMSENKARTSEIKDANSKVEESNESCGT